MFTAPPDFPLDPLSLFASPDYALGHFAGWAADWRRNDKAADWVAGKYDATLTNGGHATTPAGPAFGFAGTGYASVANPASFNFTGPVWIYIKVSGLTSDVPNTLFSMSDSTTANNFFYLAVGNGITANLTDELIWTNRTAAGVGACAGAFCTADRSLLFDGGVHEILFYSNGSAWTLELDRIPRTITLIAGRTNDGQFGGLATVNTVRLGGLRLSNADSQLMTGNIIDFRIGKGPPPQQMLYTDPWAFARRREIPWAAFSSPAAPFLGTAGLGSSAGEGLAASLARGFAVEVLTGSSTGDRLAALLARGQRFDGGIGTGVGEGLVGSLMAGDAIPFTGEASTGQGTGDRLAATLAVGRRLSASTGNALCDGLPGTLLRGFAPVAGIGEAIGAGLPASLRLEVLAPAVSLDHTMIVQPVSRLMAVQAASRLMRVT